MMVEESKVIAPTEEEQWDKFQFDQEIRQEDKLPLFSIGLEAIMRKMEIKSAIRQEQVQVLAYDLMDLLNIIPSSIRI
ncbi:hypothetical protein QE152_g26836 [Popillia japonica]|uniref:Uncharacterized protein n=1 Tax=Popillia japonica TaxID=7064 RepID=A0AAW1JX25_POPJA